MSRLVQILDGLDAEVERARAHAEWVAAGSKGQHAPFHGDFASASPSVLERLAWWTRELRGAACEPCDCARLRVALTAIAGPDTTIERDWLATVGELEPAVIGMVEIARKALAPPVRP